MKPFSEATELELSQIKGICFDIDDTFSTHGKITQEAFDSIWKLHRRGLKLIPITGRPAGWCDHIARFWPIDAIVGENGAFSFFMKDGRLQRIATPDPSQLRPSAAQAR